MTRHRLIRFAAAGILGLTLVACGDGSSSDTTVVQSSTTTVAVTMPANAVFPAPGTVYDTPEAATTAFIEQVLGVPARLGEFQAGDSLSGEIDIHVAEASSEATRGTILLRHTGPDDPWYVTGVVNEHSTIASPEAGSIVPAGSLTVTGVGRGFEGLVHVYAVLATDPGRIVAEARTQAGSMEESLPYSVELDLSTLAPGDRVILVVRGGVGLETDPGDVGALGIVIG